MAVFDAEMADGAERGLPVAIHTVQGGSTAVSATGPGGAGYLGPELPDRPFPRRDRGGPRGDGADRHPAELRGPLRAAARRRRGSPGCAAAHARGRRDVSLSIDATSLAPVNLFEAMNVAWNLGIPWQGYGHGAVARADVPARPRDGDDRRRPRARPRGRDRLAHAGQARRTSSDPWRRPQRRRRWRTSRSAIVRSVTPANVDSVSSTVGSSSAAASWSGSMP